MDIKSFREIMKDIDTNTDGKKIDLDFLLPTGKVTGTWEWLGDPKEWEANTEVIVVGELDEPPIYVPIANILAIKVTER